jgi:hypothetical protein
MKLSKFILLFYLMIARFVVVQSYAQEQEKQGQAVIVGGLGVNFFSGFNSAQDLRDKRRNAGWLALESGYAPHISFWYLPKRNLNVLFNAGTGFLKSSRLDTTVLSGNYNYRIRYRDQFVQVLVTFIPFASTTRFPIGIVGMGGLHYTTEKHFFKTVTRYRSASPGWGFGLNFGYNDVDIFPITICYYRMHQHHLLLTSINLPIKVLKRS